MNLPLLGAEASDFVDHCLPLGLFEQLVDLLSLDAKILGKYAGIPPHTLSRMANAGLFTVNESKNLAALIRVLNAAIKLFEGDVQATRAFLTSPSPSLNSKTPLEVLSVGEGSMAVTDLIGRLEHGIPI